MSGGMEEAAEIEKAIKTQGYSYQDKVRLFTTQTSTSLVIADMKKREGFGFKKYGKYLNEHTDEDMLNHLYNELLDASVYIRTLLEQRKSKKYDPTL